MFKIIKSKLKSFLSVYDTPQKRSTYFITKLSSGKSFFYIVVVSNIFMLYYYVKFNNSNYNHSVSRYVSRKIGSIMNINIPEYFREFIYNLYIKNYNVNKDEMIEKDLNKYDNLKKFFTREIDLNLRPIENQSNNIVNSPCDGKILSISEVKELSHLLIVKGITYSLLEFLFGSSAGNQIVNNININPTKKMYQVTIYLSPGDCHRYYSPSNMYTSSRIYIPGFLEPVKPSYIKKHKRVLCTNERVTLINKIEDTSDYLFMTFVGALNVGTISLSFDDFLNTNQKLNKEDLKNPGFYVIDYANILYNGIKHQEKKLKVYYKPSISLLNKEIQNEFSEFDARDMIDLDKDIVKDLSINVDEMKVPYLGFKVNQIIDNINLAKEDLKYSIHNNFLSYSIDMFKMKKKLKSTKGINLEKYSLSNLGIYFKKRDELGWFNFGSTIVLIFTIDSNQNIKFRFNEGDVVKIGQSLYDIE